MMRRRYEIQTDHPIYGWIPAPEGCQPTNWQARTMKYRLEHFQSTADEKRSWRLVELKVAKVLARKDEEPRP